MVRPLTIGPKLEVRSFPPNHLGDEDETGSTPYFSKRPNLRFRISDPARKGQLSVL
jgi:hypothetical protein